MTLTIAIQEQKRHILPQWRLSPWLVAMVETILELRHEQMVQARDATRRNLNLDHATGIWLDFLGFRLGVIRPLTDIGTTPDWFSFRDPRGYAPGRGMGFNRAPFIPAAGSDVVGPLPDELFRNMLYARRTTIFSQGRLEDFLTAARYIDPDISVVDPSVTADGTPMVINVTTELRQLIEIACEYHCLSCNAGVKINYV